MWMNLTALARDVLALGAVNVDELTRADWEQLPGFQDMRPMERRRLLRYVVA